MGELKISVSMHGAIATVAIKGFIDTVTANEIDRAFSKLYAKDVYTIIADFTDVAYVSSAGWGAFIRGMRATREHGGDLVITCMPSEVYDIFQIMSFANVLQRFPATEDAVDYLSSLTPKKASDSLATETKHRNASGASQPPSSAKTLEDVLCAIVKEHPLYTDVEIRKALETSGHPEGVAIGFFAVKKLLRALNLDTPSKRRTFAER